MQQITNPKILVVDDEAAQRAVLKASLERAGYSACTVKDGAEALSVLKASHKLPRQEHFQALISDVRMPGMDGMSLLKAVSESFEDLPCIMVTAHGTVDLAVQAIKEGAFDFLTKPFERDELLQVVAKAVRQESKNIVATRSWSEDTELKKLVGSSNAVLQVREIIKRIADTPTTALIMGESGTGKELVAHALHHFSKRKDKPFIRINCAAIPENLIEAELFGHEKGAFTGAHMRRPGRFELAHEGTLFLDEIGELPLEMQPKLLRVLQESTFERVGGIDTIRTDIRLIAATNRNLRELVRAGRFREDLFYRVHVVPIVLPPLRDRKDDIPTLTRHFLNKLNVRLGRDVQRFSEGALQALMHYDWPGNIRELENAIERAVLFANSKIIETEDLPGELLEGLTEKGAMANKIAPPKAERKPDASLKEIVRLATAEIESNLIREALLETEGNISKAARTLKISRKSLQAKVKEFGLNTKASSAQV